MGEISMKRSLIIIATIGVLFIFCAAEESTRPLYLELTECAECNYYHSVRDNLFPIFIALAKMERHRTFKQNTFYCNKYPFKPEVFRTISNNTIRVKHYDPETMDKLYFGDTQEAQKYFSLFLAQLHERFNVTYKTANRHRFTVTLVQRHSTRRYIKNFEQACKDLKKYCDKKQYHFNAVFLEQSSFHDQLQLAANTDVFIVVHGAAATNAAFIRKNGFVVELIPYNFKNNFFRDMIHTCRPDIRYHAWQLQKEDCSGTTFLPHQKKIQYRYWRDQAVNINTQQLIFLLDRFKHSLI